MDNIVAHIKDSIKVYMAMLEEEHTIDEDNIMVCCMDNTLKLNFKIYIFLIFAYNQLN